MRRFAALLGLVAVACSDPPMRDRVASEGVGGTESASGAGGSDVPASGGSSSAGSGSGGGGAQGGGAGDEGAAGAGDEGTADAPQGGTAGAPQGGTESASGGGGAAGGTDAGGAGEGGEGAGGSSAGAGGSGEAGGSGGAPNGGASGSAGAGGSGGADGLELVWEVTRTGEFPSNNLVAYYRIYVSVGYPKEQYPGPDDPPECGRYGYHDQLTSGYAGTRVIPITSVEAYCFRAPGTVRFAIPVEGYRSNHSLLTSRLGTMPRPSKPVEEEWELVELRHIVRALTFTPGPTNPDAMRYIDETWQLWGKRL